MFVRISPLISFIAAPKVLGSIEATTIVTRGVRDTGNETSQMNLSTGIIQKFKLSIPPLDEQTQIVLYLDREAAMIDVLLIEAQHAIDLLQERRTALISAAVTGQIDVRGAVAALALD